MSEGTKAVFLSYASQDAEAAKRICDALRAAGVEVWFDQSELVGGDAWDAKIRKQIKECALFVPVISANTQARREGYFRIEWKLAAQRMHAFADGTPFLLPIVIDATRDGEALVPEEFRAVQWTRLPGGETPPTFAARVKKLLGGSGMEAGHPRPGQTDGVYLPVAATEVTTGVASPVESRGRTRWVVAAIGVVLAGVALASWRPWKRSEPLAAATAADNSVAVLPFTNLSADKANEYFSDGISEEICNRLGTVPGLRVPAVTSSFQFRGRQVSPGETARQLNVAYLVDGSVQREGERVRIRARLVDPKNGLPLWTSENFDRDIKDVFSVQDEIAGLIVRQLRGNLRYAAGANTAQVRPEAFQLYLQGRQAWSARGNGLAQAQKLFEAAIELDPKFGRAYSGLADAKLLGRPMLWSDRASPALMEIVRTADTAVQLEPGSAEAHISRGTAYLAQWNLAEAERSMRTAIRLNGNYAHAHYMLALLLEKDGRMDEAILAFSRAAELDPLTPVVLSNYSYTLLLAGRYTDALAQAEQAIRLEPNADPAEEVKVDALLALARNDESLLAARETQSPAILIKPLMASGLRAEAEQIIAKRTEREARIVWWRSISVRDIRMWAAMGRYEELLASLPEDFHLNRLNYLLFSPEIDPMRKDSRFFRFLAMLGVTEPHERAQKWRATHPPEKAPKK